MEENLKTGSSLFEDDMANDPYDPFDDDTDIDDEEENVEVAPETFDEAMLAHKPEAPFKKVDERTASQKLNDLIAQSNDQRQTFLRTLAFCVEPKPVFEVNEMIDKLKERNHTVYSAANFCSLLERSGGLARVTEDGLPYDDVDKSEGRTVVVDGVEYLESEQAPQAYWKTTPEGKALVDEDDPYRRLRDLLDGEPDVIELYLRVLLMCARGDGATARDLASVVDRDPLAQNPVLTSAHFSIPLKRCGAIDFAGSWHITELGMQALADVFGIEEGDLPSEIADVEAHAVPVEAAPAEDIEYFGD